MSGPRLPAAPAARSVARPFYLPQWFRRVYQVYFLVFFFAALALMTDMGLRVFPTRLLFHVNPLTAVSTLAASWLLPASLLLSLIVVALTLLFGRAFCGWICPVGALNQFASYVTRRLRRGPPQVVNRWRPHFRLKYLLLVGLLAAALSGTMLVGLFDPLSLAARSISSALVPAARAMLGETGFRPRIFAGAWLIGGLFLAVLVANRWVTRWWCRALCPLGALLGWTSRAAIFRIHVDPDLCNQCHLCARDCQGADEPFDKHRVSECHVCLNCVASCPEGAITFRPFAPAAAPAGGVEIKRRQLLGAALAGVALWPLFRASAGSAASPGPYAIRPPAPCPRKRSWHDASAAGPASIPARRPPCSRPWTRPASKPSGRRSWSRGAAGASRAASAAAMPVPQARSAPSVRTRRAGPGKGRGSGSGPRFSTGAAVCPGRCPPPASSARKSAPRARRRSGSKRPPSSAATGRGCAYNGPTWTRPVAWAADCAKPSARSTTWPRSASPGSGNPETNGRRSP